MKEKTTKTYKYIFVITALLFFIFFIGVTNYESYSDNKKLLLFVNGPQSFSNVSIQQVKVNSIAYGIWGNQNSTYQTNDKYILMKMKSGKVLLSSNNLSEIIDYIDRKGD